MFLIIIINDIQIQRELKSINVGRSFFIDAHISKEEVKRVKKCIYQSSIPNINPGTIIIAFAIHAKNSIVL
jgi:hypothetical protein